MTQNTDEVALKVIFLDIDGVLVTRRMLSTRDPDFYHYNLFDPDCVRALNRITEQSGAVLVLSSSWRVGSRLFPRVLTYINRQGVTAPIVGRTPQLLGFERGDEIRQWLDEHWPIETFVVFDDDSDMTAVRNHHIKTTLETGLTDYHVAAALEILGARQPQTHNPTTRAPQPSECTNNWHKWPEVDTCPQCGARTKSLNLRVTREETTALDQDKKPTECTLREVPTGNRLFSMSWRQGPDGPVEQYHVIVGLDILSYRAVVISSHTFFRKDFRLEEGIPEEYEDWALQYIQYYFRMSSG